MHQRPSIAEQRYVIPTEHGRSSRPHGICNAAKLITRPQGGKKSADSLVSQKRVTHAGDSLNEPANRRTQLPQGVVGFYIYSGAPLYIQSLTTPAVTKEASAGVRGSLHNAHHNSHCTAAGAEE